MEPKMENGKTYYVRYHYQAGNGRTVERESIMKFLSEDENEYWFSLRPLAGTQQMPKDWVDSIKEMTAETKLVMPRKPQKAY